MVLTEQTQFFRKIGAQTPQKSDGFYVGQILVEVIRTTIKTRTINRK